MSPGPEAAPPLLVRGLHTLVTMAAGEPPLHGVDLLLESGRVAAIGRGLEPGPGTRVIDGADRVAYPGFINTHHHLFQTLTRNLPRVHTAGLFDWLTDLYPVWRELGPDAAAVSARVGIAELLLSGCTTTSDHFYVFPRGAPDELLDYAVDAALETGIRFHPTRGSMSRGRSDGGLPPDDTVQATDAILRDSERLIDKYHDPEPFSMCRVALAPCSPFSVTPELLRLTAELARERGVRLHTHLAETEGENAYCLDAHGMRPLDFMEESGWLGEDVWLAHGIFFDDGEIARLAANGTGIAHCPASNLRLGSGICRVPALLRAGVPVGLAVDGSASNDASSMTRELQLALLVHRLGSGVSALPPMAVLEMATRGSAQLLGRDELGRIELGTAADVALFRLDGVELAGAMHAPETAILFCAPGARADLVIVAGRVLVEDGRLVGVDEKQLARRANEIAGELVRRAGAATGID